MRRLLQRRLVSGFWEVVKYSCCKNKDVSTTTHPLWFCYNTGAHSTKLLSHWKIRLCSFTAWTHKFTERRELLIIITGNILSGYKSWKQSERMTVTWKNLWRKKVVQCNSESHKFPPSQWAGIYKVKNAELVCTRLTELCLRCTNVPQSEPSPFRKPKSDLLLINRFKQKHYDSVETNYGSIN